MEYSPALLFVALVVVDCIIEFGSLPCNSFVVNYQRDWARKFDIIKAFAAAGMDLVVIAGIQSQTSCITIADCILDQIRLRKDSVLKHITVAEMAWQFRNATA